MHEKDLSVAVFLDLYGDILEERPRQILDMYFNEDYSLSEISELLGITRQGVGESVRKSVKRLRDMEEKLHFVDRIAKFEKCRDELAAQVLSAEFENSSEISEKILSLGI